MNNNNNNTAKPLQPDSQRTYVDTKKTGSTGRTAGEGGGLKHNPDQWKTGSEPMTSAQKSYLQTLAREANEPLPGPLTKAEAAKHIAKLQKKTGRGRK